MFKLHIINYNGIIKMPIPILDRMIIALLYSEYGVLSIKEISEMLGICQKTAYNGINSLLNKGLIEKCSNEVHLLNKTLKEYM